MAQNYQYGSTDASPLQNELRNDLMQGEAQQNEYEWHQGSVPPESQNASSMTAQQQPAQAQTAQPTGKNKQRRRGFLAFGAACLLGAIVFLSVFNTSARIDTSTAATDALQTGNSATLPVGTILASNDRDTSLEPTDYTITGTTENPTTKIHVWDYAGEDGDFVQVLVDGSPITEEFMIKHQPREIEVPSKGTVQVRGIHDAGGGLTYAVHCDLNGESYFNNAPEGVLNTYTLMAG